MVSLGPWQVMLKQGDGSYACVAESSTRFTLGEVYISLALKASVGALDYV